jgi:hypothetical protein
MTKALKEESWVAHGQDKRYGREINPGNMFIKPPPTNS